MATLQAPRVPQELEQRRIDRLDDEDYFDRLELSGEVAGWKAKDVEIVECRVTRVRATGSDLRGLRLRDVLLEGCDLSGAIVEGARFNRVAFVDCRLSGTVLSAASLQHVTFSDCRMDQVSLRMSTGTSLRFRGCDLRTAELAAVDMQGSEFLDCDLTGADITNATLANSSMHGSRMYDLSGVLTLRDVVVDSEQAFVLGNALLAAHGIRVTEQPTRE